MNETLELALMPFQLAFMQNAFLVMLMIAVPMALLSCYLVLKGWSLMGDAVSHAVLPGVVIAYVVGLPDTERGQLVVAAVVPREGAKLDFGEIEATLRKQLSSYKVPRAYVEIAREDVPMLHSNKVGRRLLAEMMAEKLGRPAP